MQSGKTVGVWKDVKICLWLLLEQLCNLFIVCTKTAFVPDDWKNAVSPPYTKESFQE